MIILPDRNIPRAKFLLPVLDKEWREPSQHMKRDVFGNLAEKTMFRIRAKTHDGVILWTGWFEDRSDFDAFLWSIFTGTLQQHPELWNLCTPSWPELYPGLLYDFATSTYLTSTATTPTWSRAPDYNSVGSLIECIGAGGGGSGNYNNSGTRTQFNGGTGGGGGAYSSISNLSLPSSVTYQVGAKGTGGAAWTTQTIGGNAGTAGGDTWFNGSGILSCSVGAKGGSGGLLGSTNRTGGGGGSNTGGTGSVRKNGGNYGALTILSQNSGGTGGGGAGGPNGDGARGGDNTTATATGSGGGGSNGGSAAGAGTSTAGGNGGNNRLAAGGGAGANSAGTGLAAVAGTSGAGGGGGQLATIGAGANGGNGQEWTASYGCGGGGGGSGYAASNGPPGTSSGYGGGGGGGSSTSYGGADGSQGLIIITYTPSAGGFNMPNLGM